MPCAGVYSSISLYSGVREAGIAEEDPKKWENPEISTGCGPGRAVLRSRVSFSLFLFR
jgi:hypothetical protein